MFCFCFLKVTVSATSSKAISFVRAVACPAWWSEGAKAVFSLSSLLGALRFGVSVASRDVDEFVRPLVNAFASEKKPPCISVLVGRGIVHRLSRLLLGLSSLYFSDFGT